MKRLAFWSILIASVAVLNQCRSDDDENGGNGSLFTPGGDPIDQLDTPRKLYSTIINAGEIKAKSVAAESILRFAEMYESAELLDLVHIPDVGSDFYDADYNRLNSLFPGLTGPNDFYLNQEVFQPQPYTNISFYEQLAPIELPIAAVNHMSRVRGDSVIVNAKVQFFENINRRNFYVASYLAAEIPAENFDQGPNFTVPTINNFLTNADDVSEFINPFPNDSVFIFREGEKYNHRYVIIGEPKEVLGVRLEDVNLFGREFQASDVLGSMETPIRMALPKTHPAAEFATGFGIWTVMYELEEEVDPADPNGPPLITITMINSRFSTF